MAQKVFEIFIPGRPVGKGRPKIVRRKTKDRGVMPIAVTPDATVNAEQAIRSAVFPQWKLGILASPLAVRMTAYVLKPPSRSKKDILPTSKPDWDNVGKLICDSLNGICWKDDAVIADGGVRKRWCCPAFPAEGIHMVVYTLGEEDV